MCQYMLCGYLFAYWLTDWLTYLDSETPCNLQVDSRRWLAAPHVTHPTAEHNKALFSEIVAVQDVQIQ